MQKRLPARRNVIPQKKMVPRRSAVTISVFGSSGDRMREAIFIHGTQGFACQASTNDQHTSQLLCNLGRGSFP